MDGGKESINGTKGMGLVGYMMAGWDSKKRTLHDRMFAACVLKVNK
jgi:hypothetical protein